MTEKDINGMRSQNWTAKDTSLTEKARDNNKSKVTDSKLSKLYEALTEVIITSVKDSYGKNSDKKYIYQTDMLMSRVRKALTEKLSDLQIDSIKQLVIDNAKQQDVLLSKMLLNAFNTLSVKIDKNAQAKLVEKIAVVVNKLLKSYVAKNQSSKSNSNDMLTEIVSALKSSSKSQATHKAKEVEIKQYQSKAYKLISKTLDAVNQNHTIAIQSMTAGFKHTTETISNEVSLLQENIEDANNGSSIMSLIPQLKNASAIAKFANPMSWFKTFVVNPMKLLFSGLWNFLLKPMLYVGKFLLKPIGYLVKGIWDNFIKKPIAKLIELTGTVLGAVTSAATTALSVFFLTPKGAYILGYAVGYVWSRWIEPIVTPILKFANEHILPLLKSIAKWSFKKIEDLMHYVGEPLLKMLNGDETFNEAMKEIMFKWVLGDDIYKKDENGNKIKQTDDKGNVLLQKDGITPKYEMKDWSSLIYDSVVKGVKAIWDIKIPGLNVSFTLFGKSFTFQGTIGDVLTTMFAYYLAHGITTVAIATKIGADYLDKVASGLMHIMELANKNPALAVGAVTAAAVASTVSLAYGVSVTNEYLREEDLEKKKQLRDKAKFWLGNHVDKLDEITAKNVLIKSQLLNEFNRDYQADEDWFFDNINRLIDSITSNFPNVQTSLNTSDYVQQQLKELIQKMSITNRQLFKKEIEFYNKNHKTQLYLSDEIIDMLNGKTKTPTVEEKVEELKLPVEVSTSAPNAIQTQYSIDKTIDDLLMPLGTAAYLVRIQNDKFEEVKKELIREESAEQISQLARDASKKVAEQSAKLAAKEYENAMEAALDMYGIKMSKLHEANSYRLNKAMLEDVRSNQDEFLKRMDKLQITLEKLYLSKGENKDYAKYWSNMQVNIYKDQYVPMRNKDRYTVDPITNGDY